MTAAPPTFPTTAPARWRRRRLAVEAAGLLYALIVFEAFLRVFSPFPMVTGPANVRPHEVLGHVMDPRAAPDIDEDGFRNARVAETAELVAIGDSMTYGYNVRREEAWPFVAGRALGMSVYSLAIGGFGPIHYSWLFDRALEKRPKIIVLGLNPGYELGEVCAAFALPHWKTWAEERGFDVTACGGGEQAPQPPTPTPAPTPAPPPAPPSGLLAGIKAAIKSTATGSAFGHHVVKPFRAWLERDPGAEGVLFQDGRQDTVLSERYNAYTLANCDLSLPQNRLAAEVTALVFEEMAAKARERGILLVAAMLPTRHSVIRGHLEAAGYAPPAAFYRVIEGERAVEATMLGRLRALGVPVIETRPALIELVRRVKGVYPFTSDGHPLTAGYAAIGEAVAAGIAAPR